MSYLCAQSATKILKKEYAEKDKGNRRFEFEYSSSKEIN
jgi:hypothetical protein